jgi:hypothetical protein
MDYVPCSEWQGKTLTLNHCNGWSYGLAFYDTDKNYISGIEYQRNVATGDTFTFTVPDDAIYIRFSVDVNYKNEIKLEEGTESTAYIPYGYKIPLNEFPQKVEEVYNKGAQDEYDRFWDSFQDYGNMKFYGEAFAGYGWTDETFKPKYPIVTDTQANRTNSMFSYAKKITNIMIPLYFYDKNSNSTFANCSNLKKIGDDTGGGIWTTRYRTWPSNFGSCSNLEEIRFLDYNEKGEYVPSEIGNSIDFKSCTLLSVASMINIIKHLVDYSTDSTGTYTLTLHDDAWTRLSEAEQQGRTPQSEGIDFTGTWREYVSSIGWNS